MDISIYMWVAMMVRRGIYRRVLQHMKDERTLVMMAWYTTQVGEIVMLLRKRVGREMPNKKQ